VGSQGGLAGPDETKGSLESQNEDGDVENDTSGDSTGDGSVA